MEQLPPQVDQESLEIDDFLDNSLTGSSFLMLNGIPGEVRWDSAEDVHNLHWFTNRNKTLTITITVCLFVCFISILIFIDTLILSIIYTFLEAFFDLFI